jgi:hypothetical protein
MCGDCLLLVVVCGLVVDVHTVLHTMRASSHNLKVNGSPTHTDVKFAFRADIRVSEV